MHPHMMNNVWKPSYAEFLNCFFLCHAEGFKRIAELEMLCTWTTLITPSLS